MCLLSTRMHLITLHVLQDPRDASSFPSVWGGWEGWAGDRLGAWRLDWVQSTAVMLAEGCSPHWWVHSGPNAQHGVEFSRDSTSLTPQQGGNGEWETSTQSILVLKWTSEKKKLEEWLVQVCVCIVILYSNIYFFLTSISTPYSSLVLDTSATVLHNMAVMPLQ